MPYQGPERRLHRVFVTRNTEYHLRAQVCVGVRDRQTGAWLHSHFALSRRIAGAIRFFESGAMSATPGLPEIGDSLYFEELGRDLVTGSVIAVERPPRELLPHYAGTARARSIEA